MTARFQLSFERTARDGGRVRCDGEVVAEINRLALVRFVPRPGAGSLVGADVGVPLYWRQYGNHQNPERRADSRRELNGIESAGRTLRMRATGAVRSSAAISDYDVTFRVDACGRLTMAVAAVLRIPVGPGWRVTPHPHHGEAVFCTLWPTGVFSPDGTSLKRYSACLVQRGHRARRIAHHHLESPDKQRIRLGPGDVLAWGLEDENPSVTIGAGTKAEAGICAYMWDTHFAIRVCRAGRDVVLRPGTELRASYLLEGKTRRQLASVFNRAPIASAGSAAETPIYRQGLHTFSETFHDAAVAGNPAWPWQREVIKGREADVRFARDARTGCGDRYSLKIRHRHHAQSHWLASTLGPAFGEPAFRRGGRLGSAAMVKILGAAAARITLRWHRAGRGSVFNVAGYETWSSEWVGSRGASGSDEWIELLIETPPLRPAPDRVHLLLELKGRGTAWFDNVELKRL